MTTLHLVASCGCCERLKLLLDQGADPKLRGNGGRTPLHEVCDGVEPGDRDDLDAAFASCITLLVASGADPNVRDDIGATPLALAVSSGRLCCVKALLDAGAMLIADQVGDTPLHVAVRKRHVDCLETLLQATLTMTVMKHDDATKSAVAIYERVRGGRPSSCIKNCVEYHNDNNEQCIYSPRNEKSVLVMNNTTQDDHEALHDAAEKLDCKRLSELLATGAKPNIVIDQATLSTPLHAACSKSGERSAEAIRALCNYGADLEARDDGGNTPLHAAARAGNAHSVAALLKEGADAAIVNNSYDTPLHIAVWCRNFECCRLLIDYGAPLAATNRQGRSSKAQAAMCRAHDTADTLQSSAKIEAIFDDSTRHPPCQSSPTAYLTQEDDALLDEDAELLDDDLFFDAVISSALPKISIQKQSPVPCSKADYREQFRDPAPLGCAGSRNPLYVSSPSAPSPHVPDSSVPLPPDVKRDIDDYAKSHNVTGFHSPVSAAGTAAGDILLGLQLNRFRKTACDKSTRRQVPTVTTSSATLGC